MAYTLNTQQKRTILIIVVLIASWFLLGCDEDTCINRNDNGVCIETVSDIGTIGSEIADSFNSDGSIAPFAGNTGKGICSVAGVNCD